MEPGCYPTQMQIFKSQSKRSKAQQTTEREPGRVERLMAGPRDLSVRAQGGRGTPNVLLRAHPSPQNRQHWLRLERKHNSCYWWAALGPRVGQKLDASSRYFLLVTHSI